MLKSEARNLLLKKRKLLTEADCIKLDDLLLIQFQKLDWINVRCIGSFYPLEHQNEPNALLLIKYLKFIIPDLKVAYPKVNMGDMTMDFYEESDRTTQNKWGIQEPIPHHLLFPEALDAVMVPLIGFDVSGHRIGFGKGFYDKYFARCIHSPKRIGISYFEPIPNIEDTHEFDVPLTQCITPWNRYEF